LFYVASVGLFLGIFIELFCAPESFGSWMHKKLLFSWKRVSLFTLLHIKWIDTKVKDS
jgi:hypothetical protein